MSVQPGPIDYAPSDGGYVAHQVTGDTGPHVVVLPTLTADFASYWEVPAAADTRKELATHCRVVLIDRRGTGSSDPLLAREVADAAAGGDVLVTDAVRATTMGSGHAYGEAVAHELRGTPGPWLLAPALARRP